MHTALEKLVGALESAPQTPLSRLDILPKAERQQVLVEWNDTKVEYPQDKCIHQLFEEQALRTPDSVAVVFEDQQLSYRELNQRANQLAHYLQKRGVGPDVLVGICVERSLEMVVASWVSSKPAEPTCPSTLTPQRTHPVHADDAGMYLVLTQQRYIEKLSGRSVGPIRLDSDCRELALQPDTNSLCITIQIIWPT